MRKVNFTKAFSFILSLVLLVSHLPVATAADVYSDTGGHWAKAAIEKWSGLDILKGNNGKFRPDATISRAELSAVLYRMLKYPNTDYKIFLDLKGDEWYYAEMTALAWQGILNDSNSYAKGDTKLTRDEAAQMIARAFGLDITTRQDNGGFTDKGQPISREAVTMKNYGFINGYPDGTFRPTKTISRAEVVTVLDNMISSYIDKPGTYEQPLGNNVLVNVPGVTLKNQSMKHVFIAPGASGGTVAVTGGTVSDCVIFQVTDTKSVLSAPEGIKKIVYTPVGPHFDPRFPGGTGSEANPYRIETAAQLTLLGDNLKPAGCHDSRFTYAALTRDLTLTGLWSPVNVENNRNPLIFDGRGHTIKGLKVELTPATITPSLFATNPDMPVCFAGLFGNYYGDIRNLTVEGNVTVTGSAVGRADKPLLVYAGGFAGRMTGEISVQNLISRVNITINNPRTVYAGGSFGSFGSASAKFEQSSAFGTVVVNGNPNSPAYVGGLIGTTGGGANINSCQANVQVTVKNAKEIYAGGLTGNGGAMADCATTGAVSASDCESAYAGGLAGSCGKMENCKASGPISVSGKKQTFAGGLSGICSGTVANCIATGNVSAQDANFVAAGGLSGMAESTTDCTASGSVTASGNEYCFAGGLSGRGVKAKNCSASGDVSAHCKGKSNETWKAQAGGLMGNPIDNDNHSGVEIDACSASGRVSAQGGYYNMAGGLIGQYTGKGVKYDDKKKPVCAITRSYATGPVSASDSLMQNNAGGLIGHLQSGTVGFCWSSGLVEASGAPGYFNAVGSFVGSMYQNAAVTDCYAVGPVAATGGDASIGGFVGRFDGTLIHCYATAKVTFAGTPYWQDQVTGLVGTIRSVAVVRQCADLLDIGRQFPLFVDAPDIDNPKFTQLTNAQVVNKDTYISRGWDFKDIWAMPSGGSYKLPILRGVGEAAQKALTMPAHLR